MSPRMRAVGAACAVALGAAAAAPAPALADDDRGTVDVQLLGFNDFHGALDPPGSLRTSPTTSVRAGGVEYFATHIEMLRGTNRHTEVVSAGDLIGASPLLSALFHDEPTIEAMNGLGLDLNAVGNHEFDEGAAELLRMDRGGCHPVDGCQDGTPFEGADFRFLAANVVDAKGRPLFKPYRVKEYGDKDGARIGYIGLTLEGTPEIVSQSGIQGLRFLDEVETINRYVGELRADGVEAIVVLLHEGGRPTGQYNECPGIAGPIVDIVQGISDEVDAVVSGHTHAAYNCTIDGKLVTSAASNGRIITDITLTVAERGDVVAASAVNRVVTQDVPKDPFQTDLLASYRPFYDELAGRVVGHVAETISRRTNAAGEQPLGDLIADAQLAATAAPDAGQAVAAFMNPGGVRGTSADDGLLYTGGPEPTGGPGEVTYNDAFRVQPFGNTLVTLTLTGAQIDQLLEQQWCGQSFPRILLPSKGVTYTWDATVPVCDDRVRDIAINGVPVMPAAEYRITVNSFLADGGDAFSVLKQGTNRVGGGVDLDALEAYLTANSPVSAPALDRITRVG